MNTTHPIIINIIKLVSLTRLRICGISFLLTLRVRLSWKLLTAAVSCQSAQKSVYQLVLSHSAADFLKICFHFPYCCSYPVVVSVEAPGIWKGLALVARNYFQASKAHFFLFFRKLQCKEFCDCDNYKCVHMFVIFLLQHSPKYARKVATSCGYLWDA